MKWRDTGTVEAQSLIPARLQLHAAALILGSTAHSVLEHAADDGHTNLGFDARTNALCTHSLGIGRDLVLNLEVPTITLVVRQGPEQLDRLPLEGHTLAGALEWVRDQLERAGKEVVVSQREYPDLPESGLMSGGAFERPAGTELTEIALWFGNGLDLIESLRQAHPTMSMPRVWPHHFDLGALVPVGGDGQRMIGIGMSPGDHYYDQPYLYCSPYSPSPIGESKPPLPIGRWHTQDFVSAIVTAEELQAAPSQAQAARQYLAGALHACRALLA